jgi:hypothetical protein
MRIGVTIEVEILPYFSLDRWLICIKWESLGTKSHTLLLQEILVGTSRLRIQHKATMGASRNNQRIIDVLLSTMTK